MKVIQKNPKSWVCEQLNIGTEAIVFIDICRFVYQKNLPRLLDAFQGVVEFNPDAHLVLIGSTQNTEVYKEVCDRITELGITNQVHVVGPSLQVADWLAGSDIFVFPSLVEGMGIALAEAMSIGLPCISSNVGPIPEFIKNRENGLLVDPKSKTEIASAMIELLSNPEFAKQLGSRAKSTVDEMFNPNRQAQKLVALYEEIFAETGRKRRSIANT